MFLSSVVRKGHRPSYFQCLRYSRGLRVDKFFVKCERFCNTSLPVSSYVSLVRCRTYLLGSDSFLKWFFEVFR